MSTSQLPHLLHYEGDYCFAECLISAIRCNIDVIGVLYTYLLHISCRRIYPIEHSVVYTTPDSNLMDWSYINQ